MNYNIIQTGSKGNAVTLGKDILIDCGVTFRALRDIAYGLRLVLLTHIHGDHFKKAAIRKLAAERPSLRFACGSWLADPLLDCGVKPRNIDVLEMNQWYDYGKFKASPFALWHDVPNCGWRVEIGGEKMIYATDTRSLAGIDAKGYDLYMIECNYEGREMTQRIIEKEAAGEYVYERRAREQHLSKARCDEFIYSNIGPNGEYVYLHMHEVAKPPNPPKKCELF